MTGDGRATLKDVARIAGVSRSTASRVLNDHPSVRPEVRRRVLSAMDRVGYVRDEVAHSLRSGRSRVIALVIPRPPATVFGDAYFAALVAGVVAAGAANDRTVAIVLAGEPGDPGEPGGPGRPGDPVGASGGGADESTSGPNASTSGPNASTSGRGESDGGVAGFGTLARRLAAGGLFDGVIVAASVDLDSLPVDLVERGLPLVVVGDPDRSEVCSVDVDNEVGGHIAAEHLLSTGRRRIALLGGPVTNASARSRQVGARAAVEQAGYEPAWEGAAGDFSVRAGRELMQRCLAAVLDDGTDDGTDDGPDVEAGPDAGPEAVPDGIVAGSDAIATGVLEAVRARGLRVPEDVAVVGFDDLSPARATTPPLTTVRQPIEQVARRAVDHLVELVEGAATPGCRQVSDVELVIRGSTAV